MHYLKQIWLYRALTKCEEHLICSKFQGSIISEAYTRVMNSSANNKNVAFQCFTEDPRIALKFSKKPGYSGEIAKILVNIYSNGSCEVSDSKNVYVHRAWLMEDWIDLAESMNNVIISAHTKSKKAIPVINLISYTRKSARGYGHGSKTWLLHSEQPYKYSNILTEDEKLAITKIKKIYFKSYKAITYPITMQKVAICEEALQQLSSLKTHADKAWYKATSLKLKEIIALHFSQNKTDYRTS